MDASIYVDRLIECVKNQPALWDKRLKQHTDRSCQVQAWLEVGETLYGSEWLQYDREYKELKIKALKSRWRHVRDSYVKYLNHSSKEGDGSKKKVYVYAKYLDFLQSAVREPVAERRARPRSTPRRSAPAVKQESEVEDEDSQPDSPGEQFLKVILDEQPGSRRRVEVPMARLELPPGPVEEDADRAFLVSLLPDYKRLNDDEKLDFRIVTLNFFREARRKNLPHSSAQDPGPHQ